MTQAPVLDRFLQDCSVVGVAAGPIDTGRLAPVAVIPVPAPQWGLAATAAHAAKLRWSALWANQTVAGNEVFCLLEGSGQYILLRTEVGAGDSLPSHALTFAAADRPERHAHDLLGLVFADPPDARRWTRHQAWREDVFPLRGEEPVLADGMSPTPADSSYPFVPAHGPGVVEIPVGPVHAGIIEPGHFRFQAVGETILNLEQHLGYVHKGIEKIAQGRDAAGLARLAGRVSGDSSVAHAWAACQALERAAGVQVPERARWLRAIMAERERVANHLGDIGAVCNDVGFAFAQYQMARLKESFVRASDKAFGHRFMMDRIVPGGVAVNIDDASVSAMRAEAASLEPEVARIIAMLEDSESLEDRLMTSGRLTPGQAESLGVVGYVGKASGLDFDVRANAPYSPYDRFVVPVSHYRAGDVAARVKVRADEVGLSLTLLTELLASLPGDGICADWPMSATTAEGLGIVEGWRGEIVTYVRLDANGRVDRFFPRDPSWLNWPALELLVQNNIVPDFPVCNKSVNGSYSGVDL